MLLDNQDRELKKKLDLHHLQRLQSIPTISFLAGSTVAARELWSHWLNESGRTFLACPYGSRLSLFESWVSGIARDQRLNLRQFVLEKLAGLAGKSVQTLSCWLENTSEYQKRLFWRQLSPQAQILLWQWLLDLTAPGKGLDSPKSLILPEWFTAESFQAIAGGIASTVALIPEDRVPGIMVQFRRDEPLDWIRNALTELVELAEAVPTLPIAVSLPFELAEPILTQGRESRAKAILRNGWIEIPPPQRESLENWLRDRGVKAGKRQQAIIDLAEKYGASERMLETATLLTEPDCKPETEEEDKKYRSQAERLLYDFLESRATTAGRFQLNERLDFNFGSQPIEVDLVDCQSKLAIEIDGYYHFKSLENYRRDRRKDYELQRHGYIILRFLAQDIVSELEEIFQRVEKVLALNSLK